MPFTADSIRSVRARCRSLTIVATAALLAAVAPPAQAQSCETGDARVLHDPVESLTALPASGLVELEADKQSGEVTIVSAQAPRLVTVPSPTNLRGFTAVTVGFFFAKTSDAKIRVHTASPAGELDRYVNIEQDATVCRTINGKSLAAGTFDVDAGNVDANPLEVFLGQRFGEYTLTIEGRFRANIPYRLVFYSQKDKGEPPTAVIYDVFVGAEDGSVEPDPALKILPLGADPATGCAGTDVSNLDDAYVAELQARQLIKNLDDSFDTSDLSKWIAPTKADDDRVRKLLELSIEHMKCVRKIVERRDDLDASSKQFLLEDIDSVIATDREAIDRLDIKNPDVKNRALQELGQLRNANTSIGFALSKKESIGDRLQPGGYTPPTVPAGYTLGAGTASAMDVITDAATRFQEKADDLKAKLEQLRDVVRNQGTAGVKRIVASNQDPACIDFVQAALLGELSAIGVAVDRLRREELDKAAAKVVAKLEKQQEKLVKQQEKTNERFERARAFAARQKKPLKDLQSSINALFKAKNIVEKFLARLRVILTAT